MPREGSPAAPFRGHPSPASSVFQERTCALAHLNSASSIGRVGSTTPSVTHQKLEPERSLPQFKAGPRNHECYTVEKPFAGADDLGPGKGLRRLQDRMDLDPFDVALEELTGPQPPLLKCLAKLLQVQLHAAWMDLERTPLNRRFNLFELSAKALLGLLGFGQPGPDFGGGVAFDDEPVEALELMANTVEFIEEAAAFGGRGGHLSAQAGVDLID